MLEVAKDEARRRAVPAWFAVPEGRALARAARDVNLVGVAQDEQLAPVPVHVGVRLELTDCPLDGGEPARPTGAGGASALAHQEQAFVGVYQLPFSRRRRRSMLTTPVTDDLIVRSAPLP